MKRIIFRELLARAGNLGAETRYLGRGMDSGSTARKYNCNRDYEYQQRLRSAYSEYLNTGDLQTAIQKEARKNYQYKLPVDLGALKQYIGWVGKLTSNVNRAVVFKRVYYRE